MKKVAVLAPPAASFVTRPSTTRSSCYLQGAVIWSANLRCPCRSGLLLSPIPRVQVQACTLFSAWDWNKQLGHASSGN
ncbi:hypothetical protein HDV63DRAFT_303570 [Trichoderma sp. SZMC 28014]